MTPQNENNTTLVPAQAVPETTKAVTRFTAEHGREVGLPSPEAVNYMTSIANLLTRSALITPDMGTDPEQIKANAIAKMLVGRGLGITDPMQALQDIYIVKGKIFIGYPQMIGVMLRRGFRLEWLERSEKRAALKVEPPANYPMLPETFEFTIEDAQKAGLVRDGSQYRIRPRVMLTARVVSEAYRTTGGGSVYDPGEREEIEGGSNGHEAPFREAREENPFTVTAKAAENGTAAGTAPSVTTAISGKDAGVEKPPVEQSDSLPAADAASSAGSGSPTGQVKSPDPQPPVVQSGQLETVAPPAEKPRGRRATKPEPPKPEEAKDKLKQSAPPEGFKATDEDLPPNLSKPGPQLVPPKPELSQLERLRGLGAYLAERHKRDAAQADAAVRAFLKGFLSMETLPKPPNPHYETLPLWESFVREHGADLLANPHAEGQAAGNSWNQFVRHIDQWPEDMKALATSVAIQRFPAGVMDLIEFLELSGITEPGREMRIFLQVFRISREAVVKLRDTAAERKASLEHTVGSVDLEQATEADVLTAIAAAPVHSGQDDDWEEPR